MLYLRPELGRVRFCFATALAYSPYFRLLCRLTGRPGSASRESMTAMMRAGEHLALITGGFHEASISSELADRVFLKDRAGFIKFALAWGYRVAPVYVFGCVRPRPDDLHPFRARFDVGAAAPTVVCASVPVLILCPDSRRSADPSSAGSATST